MPQKFLQGTKRVKTRAKTKTIRAAVCTDKCGLHEQTGSTHLNFDWVHTQAKHKNLHALAQAAPEHHGQSKRHNKRLVECSPWQTLLMQSRNLVPCSSYMYCPDARVIFRGSERKNNLHDSLKKEQSHNGFVALWLLPLENAWSIQGKGAEP